VGQAPNPQRLSTLLLHRTGRSINRGLVRFFSNRLISLIHHSVFAKPVWEQQTLNIRGIFSRGKKRQHILVGLTVNLKVQI
jgi:hypothetical protein